MAVLAQSHTVVCRSCSTSSNMTLYLILSTGVPPPPFVADPQFDYLQYHECPACGDITIVGAPLLITNFGGSPPLLFVPMEGESLELNQQRFEWVLEQLRKAAGDAWRIKWLSQLQVIDRHDLPRLWR
jgi:hypothetical protein